MAIAILIFLGLLAILWTAFAISPAHRETFRRKLTAAYPVPTGAPTPSVVLVIPARNEGAMLPGTVPSWCTQDYPDLRVIVVDDQSEDDTAAVLAAFAAEYPNLTPVSAAPRPAGWLGKPWAVTQGVAQAPQTEWILHSDADCVFHPSAVRIAIAYATAEKLDMFSMLPRLVCETPIEKVGMAGFMGALGLVFPLGRINDPKRPESAIASGGFILVKREAYEAIGGHAAVKSEMIEDAKLALLMKRAGRPFRILLTPDLVSTRMYDSFDDLWEGITKNAYAGFNYRPVLFLGALAGGFIAGALPPVYLLASIVWAGMRPGSAEAWVAVALSLYVTIITMMLHGRATRALVLPWWHALGVGLSGALLAAAGVASLWNHHFSGGNLWKGRRYDRKTLLGSGTTENENQG